VRLKLNKISYTQYDIKIQNYNEFEMFKACIKELEKETLTAGEVKCITKALLVNSRTEKLVNSEFCKKRIFLMS
jgi:hypothetical protein